MRSFTNLAAVALLPAAAFAATFNVVVGGPGILKYNPEFVVSAVVHLSWRLAELPLILDCCPRGRCSLHFQAEKSHCNPIHFCEPVPACFGWL